MEPAGDGTPFMPGVLTPTLGSMRLSCIASPEGTQLGEEAEEVEEVSVCSSSAAWADTISSATGTGMLLSLTLPVFTPVLALATTEPALEAAEIVRWAFKGDCRKMYTDS